MPLNVGSRIAHYDVTVLIGEGGMGQVYQATDTKLNRQVALKILPEAFASDPDRLARFQREAQVLASLNHPNIAQIHGIEEDEGTRALVLELVEGPTLADRISKGPIPLDEALPIARQIAEALEAAHEQGIIHRDLKPANIKVKDDGTVKVLDFGLAKAFQPEASDVSASMSPTISLTAAATQMGMVIGTATYMSPEQAKGKVVDKRADVWAFGAVLFEMLTGQKPFVGDDVSDTLALVLKFEPEWEALPGDLSPVLATYLRRCLAKEPKQRVHDIADVRLAMEGAFETALTTPAGQAAASTLKYWQRPMPALLIVVGVALIVGFAVLNSTTEDRPVDRMRFVITTAETAPLSLTANGRDLAISPDGGQIIYSARAASGSERQLYRRAIGEFEGAPVRGAEGGTSPFVSPDGDWIGFQRGPSTLEKVSILGGPPVPLTRSTSGIRGASWGTDDQIVFGTRSEGLYRVSGGGGEPEPLTMLDSERGEASHRFPFVVPDHDAVLFVAATGQELATSQLAVLNLDTHEVTHLGLAGVSARYMSTGHLVYASEDGVVRAVPFDMAALEVTGNPIPLIEGVMVKTSGAADFAISTTGALVYVTGAGLAGTRTMVWVDRDGRETPLDVPLARLARPRVSPDGARAVVNIRSPNGTDVWVYDLARGGRTRLTLEGVNTDPMWTPDGKSITFASIRDGMTTIFNQPADSTADPEGLLAEPLAMEGSNRPDPYSWSPDGQVLAFYQSRPRSIWLLPMDSDRTPVPFLVRDDFNDRSPSFSPDGQWLAYVSDESGQDEVYVTPYPGPGGRQLVSLGGGREPAWSADGSELFYRGSERMVVVEIDTSADLRAGSPLELFEDAYYREAPASGSRNYDVSPTGDQFLMVSESIDQNAVGIRLVLNWLEELREAVPLP